MGNFDLENFITQHNDLEKIKHLVGAKKSFNLSCTSQAGKLIYLDLMSKYARLFILTDTEQTALKYKNDFKLLFDKDAEIFPYMDGSLYDGNVNNIYKYYEQISVLKNLAKTQIVLCPVRTLFEKFPTSQFFKENVISLQKDAELDLEELAEKLTAFGYKRVVTVSDIGEFSIRGDTTDIYGLDKNPLRIELWGNTITDLRFFNADSQRSIEKINSAEIFPVNKFIWKKNTFQVFKKYFDTSLKKFLKKSTDEEIKFFEEKYRELCELIQEQSDFDGINYYENILNSDTQTVIEQLPDDYTIVFDGYEEIKNKYSQYDDILQKKYHENLKLPQTLPLKDFLHPVYKTFTQEISQKNKIYIDTCFCDNTISALSADAEIAPMFSGNLYNAVTFIEEKRKQGYKILIATDYGSRIADVFRDFEIPCGNDFQNNSDVVITKNTALGGGIIHSFNLVILTDKELFNKRSAEVTSAKRGYKRENKIDDISHITENEYVVHELHGIGIFRGLSKIEFDGELKDYLTIEYAGKDKLYMPAEQINLLCVYKGAGAVKPPLSKMGGAEWSNIKTKVKQDIQDVAKKLIRLYAGRKTADGYAFEPDTIWQYEMEDAFPYTETPDQMKAINETKSDMELGKPMDRLICGDVGFGKTEVALRAIFKAVMSGKQAALVVPTTVLAMQHFETACERFKPFPVRIAVFSRFKSNKEIRENLEKLASGEIDIAIGTHRLLQDDVVFKDLGLLVIDEEHKFGVNHKEKFKMMKKNIDVLNMSATPIPRTLYMSLSGIRDISVIATAPTERLPVKTFVSEFKEDIVKNAINYEIERDGQVFYLYNKVQSIYEFAAYLQKLVPNAKIAVAHGKTDGAKLEKIMCDFRDGYYDVLVCSAIIESGIDIKNANTMLIHDADNFGLAQLYQLRGRVGRTDKQAYCYCLHKRNKLLTEDAQKRLKAIKEFTTFGSGYQIALRDIEIRGIGNLLGTKQHGKMISVGFDTYCSLLDDAVKELQDIKVHKYKSSVVDINVTAYIPDEWVGSKEQKMLEYKKLSEANSLSLLDEIVAEWKDRFSKLDEPVENLIKLIKIKINATNAGLTSVRETSNGIRIYSQYSGAELRLIYNKLPFDLKRYIKLVKLPKACNDGEFVMILNNTHLNFKELFNILSDLFYDIARTISEYNK
ncbi:MAG: transcription-repair coupling factor [Candidatus Gastranaerophilales bacterium]|nr:transcription-repair coupling factor [Candidatus Gastranaerophilales bacterium]